MPIVSYRRIENPFEQEGKKMYLAVVKAKDISKDLEEWREINPRDPKTETKVAKKIKESFEEQPEAFFFRNRGITLLAKSSSYNNENNILSVEFSDSDIHGLLDGGHTYAVIKESFESLTDEEKENTNLNDAYVKLEILEGFTTKDETTEIIRARNTSLQVKDQSLENLNKTFDDIKKVLAGESYANRISYKETEYNEKGEIKDIDIKEILSYLICFDRENFDDKNHPIIAYSGKTSVLNYVIENEIRLKKYYPLLPQILILRDEIYERMPTVYNDNGGKFGNLNGVNKKKNKSVELPFKNIKTEFGIPGAFIYPVLASLRNLVEVKDEKSSWKKDPLRFLKDIENELIQMLGDQALSIRNPNKLGKDKGTWKNCYLYAALEVSKLNI